jgi:PAS domain S-box-containing protein
MATAVGLQSIIDPYVNHQFPLVALYPTFVFTIWCYGGWPAWFAMVLALAAGSYLFIEPRYSIAIRGIGPQLGIALHLFAGTAVVLLSESLHRARSMADDSARLALERQRQLEREARERHRTELNLRDSEERFRQLAENISEVFWLASADGQQVLYVSPAYERVWGRTCESLYQNSLSYLDAVVPEDRERVEATFVRQREADMFSEEYRIMRPDGSVRWIWDRGFAVRDPQGKLLRVAGFAQDITDSRKASEELAAERDLLRNVMELQEHEKRLICYEIHDGFLQLVAGAAMLFEAYEHVTAEKRGELVATAVTNLRLAVQDGRRLIRGLRPSVLDEYGVAAAIDDLIDHFSASFTQITFDHDGLVGRLSREVETAAYRIVQEAMNNAKKHSGSDRVHISLELRPQCLALEVRDFGRGFRPNLSASHTFGLLGMTERARLLAGARSTASLEMERV